MRSELIIYALISLGICTYGQRNPGSKCIVEHTKANGTCKPLNDCYSVINDIMHNIHERTRCGFSGKPEIVCCPEVGPTTTTTPPEKKSFSGISERMCDEYKYAVFDDALFPSLLGEPPKKSSVDKCAHKTIPLIINYSPMPREYPHMALIGFDSPNGNGDIQWLCSGTLISDEYVLTAAHCSYAGDYGQPKYVHLGEFNFDGSEDSNPEDFNISAIISHPDYTATSIYNDIALLKLDRKVKLDPFKRPACLPTTFNGTESRMVSTGWGRNSASDLLHLKHVILQQFTTSECNAAYASQTTRRLQRGILPDTQICAGLRLRDNWKNFGPDDSGGPLQTYHPDQYCMYVVIGVRSFGKTHDLSIPEIYTRVFAYVDWIEDVVWKNNA